MRDSWRILFLDTKKSNPNHYIALCVCDALKSHRDVERVVKSEYGNAISRAIEHRCNLFFAFDGEEVDREICARLAGICGASIVWFTEDPYEINVNRSIAELFDLVFTNDSGSVAAYGEKGRHMPLAASKEHHYHAIPENDGDCFRYDVFFAGTAWPNRVSLLREILSELKGIRLKVALPHNEHLPCPQLPIPPSSYYWRTPHSEFCRFANRSRVVLGLHRSFSSSGERDTAFTPGPRLFEVAMAGSFQLVDSSLPGIANFYEDGKEYVGFESSRDCIDKLHYFLKNGQERLAIARAAQKRTLQWHTYENRVAVMLGEVRNLKRSREKLSTPGNNPKKTILLVSHNVAGVQPFGGVEVYQDLLKESLGGEFNFLFYVPDRRYALGQRYRLLDANYSEMESLQFEGALGDDQLSCPSRERGFSQMLVRHGVDLVHFQHLIGHPPSLPYIAKALGIPSVFSVHDYFVVCNSFNLIGHDGKYCDIENHSFATCDVCLNARNWGAVGSQGARRAFLGRVLEQVDVIHANSMTTSRILQNIYPQNSLASKLTICGIPTSDVPPISKDERSDKDADSRTVMQVAIVGNLTNIKGADVLIHAFNQMRNDAVCFHIFGYVENTYEDVLRVLNIDNVKLHGAFPPGSMHDSLRKMDVALFMSIWPETFCMTLSEVWQAGVVPIVSDIGALGERVTDRVTGYKIAVGQSGDLVSLLRELICYPGQLEKIRRELTAALYTTPLQHEQWLARIYNTLLSRYQNATVQHRSNKLPTHGITLKDCGVRLAQIGWRQSASIDAKISPLSAWRQRGGVSTSSNVLSEGTRRSRTQILLDKTYIYYKRNGAHAAVRRAWSEVSKAIIKVRS